MAPLTVWEENWEGIPVVCAEGEIDLTSVEPFRSLASELAQPAASRIVFDLRRTTYLDSSGLGVLVATLRRLGPGAAVVVLSEQQGVLRPLMITGLDRILKVVRSRELVEEVIAQGAPA